MGFNGKRADKFKEAYIKHFNMTNGVSESILIPDLEEGEDYTIEEIDSGNLVLKEAGGGTAVSNNIVTATVTAGKTTEPELLNSAKAAFANDYSMYEVVIEKVDIGNTSIKLGGAEFDLYAEASVVDDNIKDGEEPLKSGLVTSSKSSSKEMIL